MEQVREWIASSFPAATGNYVDFIPTGYSIGWTSIPQTLHC